MILSKEISIILGKLGAGGIFKQPFDFVLLNNSASYSHEAVMII